MSGTKTAILKQRCFKLFVIAHSNDVLLITAKARRSLPCFRNFENVKVKSCGGRILIKLTGALARCSIAQIRNYRNSGKNEGAIALFHSFREKSRQPSRRERRRKCEAQRRARAFGLEHTLVNQR